jgi:catechol 2,3-dioxygenase-like lactoylglutathione lyase family enzyme
MRVRGIDHVQLAMPAGREDEARAFYEGLLGLAEQPKPPNLAARGGCWFGAEGVQLHLGVEDGFRPARKAHPALLVDDLPALVLRLKDAGVAVVDDEPLPGFDRVYAADPFGNRLELLEPRPA